MDRLVFVCVRVSACICMYVSVCVCVLVCVCVCVQGRESGYMRMDRVYSLLWDSYD